MTRYTHKNPVAVEAVTFDEFIEYGKVNGGNIVNGMPWSFIYHGFPVTHENDDLYIMFDGAKDVRFERGAVLVLEGSKLYVMSKAEFDSTFVLCGES